MLCPTTESEKLLQLEFLGFYWIDGSKNPADVLSKHWKFHDVWPTLKTIMFWRGDTSVIDDPKVNVRDTTSAKTFHRKAVRFKN